MVSENKHKPLPLKQRTSSRSDRRDFTRQTWLSLLQITKFREYFITVNNFSIWRRHNAWAFENGKDLREYITQRYASNMVFMSLLLSTSCGILFNAANVTSQVRDDLSDAHYSKLQFWAGLSMIASILLTILSLISTFTGWAMISAVDDNNVHCIVRSSIGQYSVELPSRFITWSIYSFLISFILFYCILLPLGFFSIFVLIVFFGLLFHVIIVFSSFGRLIMHSGAMGKGRIFSQDYEVQLVPESLHFDLLSKAKCNLANNTSIMRQYRKGQQPIDRYLFDDELYNHLNGLTELNRRTYIHNKDHLRPRADSKVKFSDVEVGSTSSEVPNKVIINGRVDTRIDGNNTDRSAYGIDQLTPRSVDSSKALYSRNILPDGSDSVVGGSLHTTIPSNSSLEQWLQGTSVDNTDPRDKKQASISITEGTIEDTTDQLPVRPKGISVTSYDSTSSRTKLDERNISNITENEQFTFDYGDFKNNNVNMNGDNNSKCTEDETTKLIN
mgnify:CR=1 FL=1